MLPLDPAGYGMQRHLPTVEDLTIVEDAGYFLQEDQGERLGALIAGWLAER